jgi:peptide deformylase
MSHHRPLNVVHARMEWSEVVPTALRMPCKEVDLSDPEVLAALPGVIEDMFHTMYALAGYGLAAPQVGILWRLAVLDTRSAGEQLVLVNPEIEPIGDECGDYNEGCLSLPGFRGDVSRPLAIRVRHWNLAGERVEFDADGLLARVIQHEVDHLNGRLYWELPTVSMVQPDSSTSFVRLARSQMELLGLEDQLGRNPNRHAD